MKRIAALTMALNDDFYLRKWVEYYGAQLGRENLYIYLDGLDQVVAPFCEGTHTKAVEKIGDQLVAAEKGRLRFLSERAAELLAGGYDLVIGVDADEFLLVDPRLGLSLPAYLSALDIRSSVSGLGVDVGQKIGEESDIREDLPFLRQRHYARLSTRYTKPSVLAAPLRWGSGFHRIKGHNFHIAKDLYLFHFGYFDLSRIRARLQDGERTAQGWSGHIRKRAKTIRLVTDRPAREFDRAARTARLFQTLCRPPYAWNKPAMLERIVIVRIPDRFEDLV